VSSTHRHPPLVLTGTTGLDAGRGWSRPAACWLIRGAAWLPTTARWVDDGHKDRGRERCPTLGHAPLSGSHRAHGKYGACVRKSEWLGIDLMARALRNELVSDRSKRAGRDYLNSARTRTRCARHESVAERYRDAWLRSRHRALLVVTAAHGYHAWCLSASYSDQ
jgi:hypothetical protein